MVAKGENVTKGETDYSTRIDAETWDFIRKVEDHYPPDTVDLDVAGQRAVYNAMCGAFRQTYPIGVIAEDCSAGDVPLRCYERQGTDADAVVLYCHGGGFVVGGLDSHDDVCAEICDQTGFAVVSVDYRLSPEHVHPAAYDDCVAAFHWTMEHYDLPLVLAGDSAGANLAAAVAHTVRTVTALEGMVLIYPTLGPLKYAGSYAEHPHAPLLSIDEIEFYEAIRSNGADTTSDATFAPLVDNDFSGLPPTVVVSAECDPLCDDSEEYCVAIQGADGSAIWINEAGLIHGYLRARHTVKRARDSFSRIVAAIDAFGHGRDLTRSDLL
jgi:acetyl esterase/lipase